MNVTYMSNLNYVMDGSKYWCNFPEHVNCIALYLYQLYQLQPFWVVTDIY